MARRDKMQVLSIKLEPELLAIIPQISTAHSYDSIGSIIRQMLWTEAKRLRLIPDDKEPRPVGRKRYRT